MSCSSWQLKISEMIDGALEEAQVPMVQSHLETCHDCRQFLALQQQLCNGSFQVEKVEPPSRIWDRIESQILDERFSPSRTSWSHQLLELFQAPRFAYGLAAGLLLFVTGVVAVRTQDSALGDSETLASLESYSIVTDGNPFLAGVREGNPFFEFERSEPSNPFTSRELEE